MKEARGRRVFLPSPSQSLLLTKPVGQSPHGGGKRMEVGSDEYRLVARWIEQGMPYGSANDPVVTGIKCLPEGRIMDRGTDVEREEAGPADFVDETGKPRAGVREEEQEGHDRAVYLMGQGDRR